MAEVRWCRYCRKEKPVEGFKRLIRHNRVMYRCAECCAIRTAPPSERQKASEELARRERERQSAAALARSGVEKKLKEIPV